MRGAHVLAGTCRSAGGSHTSRNPCFTLARTASLHVEAASKETKPEGARQAAAARFSAVTPLPGYQSLVRVARSPCGSRALFRVRRPDVAEPFKRLSGAGRVETGGTVSPDEGGAGRQRWWRPEGASVGQTPHITSAPSLTDSRSMSRNG
ncbi:MAG TPA: hypothetical protein DD502_27245 [Cupriavidus sp.]|nr:hypothetical protein [Cupriavidus sp.]